MRVRNLGLTVGILPTGPLNAITDVKGVQVGHTTLIEGQNIRTGVTAILPHPGNLFQEKVPGAVFVGNGFGKLIGSTQVNELGEIETPVLLTSTLSVFRVADALIGYMLAQPGNGHVRSINPLVGETNDGDLNDIRDRHISREDVLAAIKNAKNQPVEEGAIGAGTGTIAFGFKGGIGTSSRRLPRQFGSYTVGVLVQANFGGILTVCGAPVGQELGRFYLKEELKPSGFAKSPVWSRSMTERPSSGRGHRARKDLADGSVMVVVATDAPVYHRNLLRMGARAMLGLARTGCTGSHASGDYVIAFSNNRDVRIGLHAIPSAAGASSFDRCLPRVTKELANDAMSPLFLAVVEATEEAVYNSLFQATTTSGHRGTVEALPIKETINILRRHGVLNHEK